MNKNLSIPTTVRLFIVCILFLSVCSFSGEKNDLKLKTEVEVKHTSVKDQGGTGTCWSFATTSFIESELLRMGKGKFDLSEMFFVAQSYLIKAHNNLLYHGKNNFTEGGLAHDVMNIVRLKGIVNDAVYPGNKIDGRFNHKELVNELEAALKKTNDKRKHFDARETKVFQKLIQNSIGDLPTTFAYNEILYNSESFRDSLGINPDNYVEITSFSHHPFYSTFILEIPDNWSHNSYYNLPIDELMEVMFYSLNNGFSISWDGDDSEKLFNHKKGLADIPILQRGNVSQKLRQETFLNRQTTDDHLMHIIGIVKNPEGRIFFTTKNSWGRTSNQFGGILYMSEDYIKLKTISIMVHKDGIPANIAKKLKIQ